MSRQFLACAVGYAAMIAVLRAALGLPAFLMWDVWLAVYAVFGLAAWLVVALVRRSIGDWRDVLLTLSVALLLTLTFAGGRTLIPSFWADSWLLPLERAMHGDRTPFEWMAPWFVEHPDAALFVWHHYHSYYLLLTVAVPAAIAVLPPSENRTRFLWASLFNVVILAHIAGTIFGSAGPVYWDGWAHGVNSDVAYTLTDMGLSSLVAGQIGYWKEARTLLGVTAFPSMHLAITTHWVLVAAAWRRWTMWVTVPYVAFMLLGSVVTAWHYALDGYAGILGACLTWWLAGRLTWPSRTHAALPT
jgi:hypothetical protein